MGTSPYTSESFGGYRDHPHACGDKSLRPNNFQSCRGSSPRVWGQERNFKRLWVVVRIIPTRVGTRVSRYVETGRRGDHPHACGDKFIINQTDKSPQGSSPRVWGQEAHPILQGKRWRIIPTRVGTSKSRLSCIVAKKDHPHACGDKMPIKWVRQWK